MSLFFRQLQHLIPTGQAWRTTADKIMRRFVLGVANSNETARSFVDLVMLDMYPSSTRALDLWEEHFGLFAVGTEANRRLQLESAWQQQGGQSPHYLQEVLRTAGFDVYVHESFNTGSPRTWKNPRDYTDDPLIGTVQCGEAVAHCGEPEAQCNEWLANEPKYMVNSDLTPRPPPKIPVDSNVYPYFAYVGGETFPNTADVDTARRAEFERIILKNFPARCWIVTLVNYV